MAIDALWRMPTRGVIEFDFVSLRRPDGNASAVPSKRFRKWLLNISHPEQAEKEPSFKALATATVMRSLRAKKQANKKYVHKNTSLVDVASRVVVNTFGHRMAANAQGMRVAQLDERSVLYGTLESWLPAYPSHPQPHPHPRPPPADNTRARACTPIQPNSHASLSRTHRPKLSLVGCLFARAHYHRSLVARSLWPWPPMRESHRGRK